MALGHLDPTAGPLGDPRLGAGLEGRGNGGGGRWAGGGREGGDLGTSGSCFSLVSHLNVMFCPGQHLHFREKQRCITVKIMCAYAHVFAKLKFCQHEYFMREWTAKYHDPLSLNIDHNYIYNNLFENCRVNIR